jgi:hypothetical protein
LIFRLDFIVNSEGEAIKKHEAEMEYMLFSTEGKKFPLKLPDKITEKSLLELGFSKGGAIDLEKREDGSYYPQPNSESQMAAMQIMEEKLKQAEKAEEEALKNSITDTLIQKRELTKKDLSELSRQKRILECLETGEEIDDELYYVSFLCKI